ncbi:3-oxoacyl-ACP synthase III family protein [Streptomyces chryseus]|uniref:3-oxoacyl-ACP synthase III family protein n=1 Tax=Streptomyces chryseus TaxID=68186 RepID=UPI00110FF460|nr:ketoacyl-ACP synthase III [Streptomyces chryseus]GGX44694.1 3-oxoacyl-[acyl-carrier-protein] synthase 3 [Streptomyces chryseus]
MGIGIVAVGGYVPPGTVDNEKISEWTGTDPAWVESRTGISERHYAPEEMSTSEMAVAAAAPLLEDTRLRARIALLVTATSTPDQPQPATAVLVQQQLDLPILPAFDVNAVCSGFLYAMATAQALMAQRASGDCALVVGADKYSTIMDRSDRKTVSLFGDGAGAVVLGHVPDGYGIHGVALLADGQSTSLVRVEAGGTRKPLTPERMENGDHLFRMDGRAVREWGLQFVPKAVNEALEQAGLTVSDMDRVVLHQGNTRLVEALGQALGVPEDKLALTAPDYGNTAAASIPLTLFSEHSRRPFSRGERILLASVGGGMTAGAIVLTWY